MNADPTKTHEARKFAHKSPFISARFDPPGRYVFAGAQDNAVQRYELATGKQTALAAHDSWVRAIAFSPDGNTTYTGGYDGRLMSWETAAAQPKPQRTVQAHDGWLRAVAVSPDGKLLATCGNDTLVKVWNAADGKLVHELKGHTRHVYNVAFHPTAARLVSGDLLSQFKDWDVATGKPVRDFKAPDIHKYDPSFLADYGGPYCLAFSPDGKLLAAGGITNVTNAFAGVGNAGVVVFDWTKGEKTQFHKPKENVNGTAFGAAYHPEGFLIVAAGGGAGGYLFFFKPDQANPFHQVKLAGSSRDLALHKDGLQLAVPCHDNQVRIYAMKTAEGKAKK
jgi:WD40 repeat protein